MAIYYVRKDGNDSTGDGSTAAPWLTISKALTTVAIGGGHTVNIGAGTYQESTSGVGYLYFARLFLAEVIFQSESGNAADVIVQSATSTAFTARVAGSSNITLKNLTITPRTTAITSAVKCQDAGSSNIKLDGCIVTAEAANGTIIIASAAITAWSIVDCTITDTGANNIIGIRISGGFTGMTIDGCTITTGGTCVYLTGSSTNLIITDTTCRNTAAVIGVRLDFIDGMTVDDLTVTTTGGTGAVAFQIGADQGYGLGNATRDFTIRNSTFTAAVSHGCLISSDAQDGIIENCTIAGGDQGMVLKGVDNVTVRHCTISNSTSGRGAYFKEARNCTFHSNRVIASAGYALSADDAQSSRWLYNVVEARNAQMFLWTGTNTMIECDRNHYILTGSAVWGNPNGVTCTSLAAVRAAWSGVFDNNDAKSNQLRLEA